MSCCGPRRSLRRRRRARWRGATGDVRTRACSRGPSACTRVTRIYTAPWPTPNVHLLPLVRWQRARSWPLRPWEHRVRAVRRPSEVRLRTVSRVDVPRPRGRRVARRKRPLTHLVDGGPRRGRRLLAGLADPAGRRLRFAGLCFAHGVQSDPSSSIAQWSRDCTGPEGRHPRCVTSTSNGVAPDAMSGGPHRPRRVDRPALTVMPSEQVSSTRSELLLRRTRGGRGPQTRRRAPGRGRTRRLNARP